MSQDAKISATAKVRHLLAASPAEQTQAEWAGFYAIEKEVAPKVTQSVVIFRLGREWHAIATKVFQEVTASSQIHTLPHRNKDTILGLARVRGELLICVSLAALLGIERQPGSDAQNRQARFLVLTQGGNRFVFPADEIFGVHRVIGDLQPVPSTVAQAAQAYTRGVFPWRDQTVGCLDDTLIFHTLNRSLA